MSQKKLIPILVALVIVLAGTTVYFAANRNYQVSQSASNATQTTKNKLAPKPGGECSSSDVNSYLGTEGDTQGLQCYFYSDSKDESASGKAIWIYPNAKYRQNADYLASVKNFKQFSNGIISFSYPSSIQINANTWKQGKHISLVVPDSVLKPSSAPIGLEGGLPINIELREEVFNMDNFLMSIKKGHSTITYETNCSNACNPNTDDSRVVAQSIADYMDDQIYLIFPRGKKYILVTAQSRPGGDTYTDFFAEAVLQSIKVK